MTGMEQRPRRRRGRPAGSRAGESGTREQIVLAARTEFAEHGYDRTTVRSIAEAAGVDSALVHHYFGTKENVFAAAIELAFAPAIARVPEVLSGPRELLGERFARNMLALWEPVATREPLLAVVRSAVSAEPAAAALRGFLTTQVLGRIAPALDVPQARLRAELSAAQLIGLLVIRYVVQVEPLASASVDEVVSIIAPTIQRYLTER